MSQNKDELLERQTRFINDIQSKVGYYIQEYNFTYAEIIGLLDAVKSGLMNDWLNYEEPEQ